MSGILLWSAAIAVAAALAVGIVDVGSAAVSQAEASSAADAAALAGAANGLAAASTAAERNGAELVELRQSGDIFTAVVFQNGAIATAHAQRTSVPVPNNVSRAHLSPTIYAIDSST